MVAVLIQFGVAVGHAPGSHVGLEPDDGFDSGGGGGVVELNGAKHCTVIGEGNGVHAHGFNRADQLLNIAEAVQQGVGGMDVEVDEGHGGCNGK